MPASRQAAATMRLPRSWPSRPILVTSTRGRKSSSFMRCSFAFIALRGQARLQEADEAARDLLGRRTAAGAVPGLAPVQRADQHQAQHRAVGRARERQGADEPREALLVGI